MVMVFMWVWAMLTPTHALLFPSGDHLLNVLFRTEKHVDQLRGKE